MEFFNIYKYRTAKEMPFFVSWKKDEVVCFGRRQASFNVWPYSSCPLPFLSFRAILDATSSQIKGTIRLEKLRRQLGGGCHDLERSVCCCSRLAAYTLTSQRVQSSVNKGADLVRKAAITRWRRRHKSEGRHLQSDEVITIHRARRARRLLCSFGFWYQMDGRRH